MRYPEAINLPFNGEVIREGFTAAMPGDRGPEAEGLWLVLKGNMLVVRESDGGLSLPEGALPSWARGEGEPLYLGTWQGKPLRAIRLDRKVEVPAPFVAEAFNSAEERLDDQLLTLGGMALQIFHWDGMSRHCSRCGGGMVPIEGTRGKKCISCGYEHFPHIHPCIIVLVKRDDQFLLTRKPEWPHGRYGLVAGFLDMGESLEECVVREVKEETGVEIKNIRYVGSQNWPFPSQLMAGFIADYAGGDIIVDRNELDDARWFSPHEIPQLLPAMRSIARWIMDKYAFNR